MTRRPFGLLGLSVLVLAVAVLVAGGLGWVTLSSLKVESDQRLASALAERSEKERLALWRLDSRIFLSLGLEGYRKYEDYTALYTPPGEPPGGSQYLSRLVEADIPEWMRLHVQLDPTSGWSSPEVLPAAVVFQLANSNPELNLINLTDDNRNRLAEWTRRMPPSLALAALKDSDSDLPDSSAIMVATVDSSLEMRKQTTRDVKQQAMSIESLPTQAPGPPPGNSRGANPAARGGTNFNPPAYVGNSTVVPNQQSQMGGRGVAESQLDSDSQNRMKTNDQLMERIRGGLGNSQQVVPSNPNFMGPPAPESSEKAKLEGDKKGDIGLKSIAPKGSPPGRLSPSGVVGGQGIGGPRGGGGIGGGGGLAQPPPQMAVPLAPTAMAKTIPDGAERENKQSTSKNDKEQTGKLETWEQKEKDEVLKRGEKLSPPSPPAPLPPRERGADPLAVRKPAPSVPALPVDLGPMRPKWIVDAEGQDVLVVFRPARLEGKVVYQGVWLDWERLRELLKEEFIDDFPEASLVPSRETGDAPQHQLASLPVRFESGPAPVPAPAGWTPLRLGLSLAWLAAAISLVAVWFGGWSLVDLSERRIRFVSAVTHELRTPLTSLRLYLDMLTSGMITDEVQKREYLTTLSHESNRLNQLIENVLDFAKLEKRGASLAVVSTPVWELLEPIRETWHDRLAADGKELVIISTVPPEQRVVVDPRIVQQILGNLIDNARKYTPGAADPRIWVWIKPAGRRVAFEVEDRGQGIPVSERRSIFRPFRRGGTSGATGGAGLGLALAKQWADSLGGRLIYRPADGGVGSCFRLELPA